MSIILKMTFEKNRQSIDTNSHQDHTEDVEKDPIRIRTSGYNREYGATVSTKKCPKKKKDAVI
ncbi:elastin binding protein ebpS [Staphylococcus aureus]|uniref:Elastin binding protein ebpS n=1 Tax=Staphylococcus aureus TaxID=1280 RepID=A0A380E329_STAAU|nr:elastin binding protein ebpS [Staphylococcus aureus]